VRWALSWKADPVGAAIADRHYSRKTVGSPQFCPPARTLVLRTPDSTAERGVLWVTSWPYERLARHGFGDAWICTLFRNERPELYLSSELILEALAASRWKWPTVPASGIITFVDADAVASPNPGYCFLAAGFRRERRRTLDRGLHVLRLPADEVPAAAEPLPREGALVAV